MSFNDAILANRAAIEQQMATEITRSARRLDGSLMLTPLPPRKILVDMSSVPSGRPSPRNHPAFEGAAGISSDSIVNAAGVSKGQRWAAPRSPKTDVQRLIDPTNFFCGVSSF